MQHLYQRVLLQDRLSSVVAGLSNPGKVLRVDRIEPHAPLLVRAPVNSFEFQPCDRTPQVEYLMRSFGTEPYGPAPSIHRLRRGLPGYLILFAPHAFAPQCQLRTRRPPSLPVFFMISTHFTATP